MTVFSETKSVTISRLHCSLKSKLAMKKKSDPDPDTVSAKRNTIDNIPVLYTVGL